MATYNTYTIDQITTVAGVVKTTLLVDDRVLSTGPPTQNFTLIGDFVEMCENSVNAIELDSIEIEVAETYDSTYPSGYWYTIISDGINNDYSPPELKFYLTEGGSDKYLFWGRIATETVEFSEVYISSTSIRKVRFTLTSVMTRLRDVSIADMITELLANRYTEEDPHGPVTVTSATKAGTHTGTTTYGYKVACRDASGEYAWCAEFTVTNADPTLTATEYIVLQWTGKAGATDYAIYRTTSSGGGAAESVGFVGLKGSGGSGTITYNDQGGVTTAGATQIKLSARRFVKMSDIPRVALQLAFAQSFHAGTVSIPYDEVRFKQGATTLGADNCYMLARYNTGSVASPTMSNAPYLLSSHDKYWGNRFADALDMLGYVARVFALYPYYYYSDANSRHQIDLLSRGRYGDLVTMDGSLIESIQYADSSLIPRSMRAYRDHFGSPETDTLGNIVAAHEYIYNPKKDGKYDIDYASDFSVSGVSSGPAAVNAWEKMYYIAAAGLTVTATACDGADYYDHITAGYVSASGSYEYEEAWIRYFQGLTIRRRVAFQRTYGRITATVSGASSFDNVRVLRRTQINNDIATKTFYANTVRRNIYRGTVSVEWIEQ